MTARTTRTGGPINRSDKSCFRGTYERCNDLRRIVESAPFRQQLFHLDVSTKRIALSRDTLVGLDSVSSRPVRRLIVVDTAQPLNADLR